MWKPIFNGDYLVSDQGEIWSNYRNRTMSISCSPVDGYCRVCTKYGVHLVHRLVASAFLESDGDVNHIDGNKQNNCLSNLEIVTQSENAIHCAYNISKLTEAKQRPSKEDVFEMRESGASLMETARAFNVSKTTVKNILEIKRKDSEKRYPLRLLDGETAELIPGYTCYYATNFGRILSTKSKKGVLKPQDQTNGYVKVNLIENGERNRQYIHRLVMMAFHGKSDLVVNHIDGCKTNNALSNLEYITQSENVKHSANRKLTDDDKNRIIELKDRGLTGDEVGAMFNVSKGTVNKIYREYKKSGE